MIRRIPSPTSTNGSPSPSEYASRSSAPRAEPPCAVAIASTPASTGPMQGVQPIPKATPRGKAHAGPGRTRSSRGRRSA